MHAGSETALGILIAALLFDSLAGEYPRALHPVVWLGKAIQGLLRLAPKRGWWQRFLFGVLLAAGVSVAVTGLSILVMYLVSNRPIVEVLFGAYLLKASFALHELGEAAERVLRPLEKDDLPAARVALRSLCSRDASELDGRQLLAATTQSLAENASDSIVAPIFYYLLFWVPGACCYRAINTLDAMVGYRGEYEALGKASARLDDLVNWIPARLTAVLFLLVGWLLRKNVREGWRILRRDGGNTPSPNGGRPMAAMAGLLEIRLEKPGVYALGDAIKPITVATVRDARKLVQLVGMVTAGGCAIALVVLGS